MTTVLDPNVHNLAVEGTFDDCQDTVKALFADEDINKTHKLAAVNSINWARILAQTTYYFRAYFSLTRSPKWKSSVSKVCFVVPTGNFGDVLAGYFAKKMGLPIEKLVVATNENDILDRFWKSGHYEKKAVHGKAAEGGLPADGVKAHEEGVRETLSPAMDILVSSNFERLLWFLAYEVYGKGSTEEHRKIAGDKVRLWLNDLKTKDGFGVDAALLQAAKADFESERVSDEETVETIQRFYTTATPAATHGASNGTNGTSHQGGYILDPHSAIGIAASLRSIATSPSPDLHHISLATAHPAKFANAVDLALKDEKGFTFDTILPEQFVGLDKMEKRVRLVRKSEGLAGMRSIIREEVARELEAR